MIFTIDNNSPAVVRFIPVQPASFALHNLKDKLYACPAFRDKNEPCPVCEMRHNLYKDGLAATSEKARRDANDFARNLRPIEKHYLAIIDRANPGQGVRLLAASKWLYEIILKGWVAHPCPPPEPKWYHFWTRLWNWCTGYVRPMSALHEQEGVDFIIRREMKRAGAHSFASYDKSTYATTRSPLGKKTQVEQWKTQATELLNTIQFPSSTELSTTHNRI